MTELAQDDEAIGHVNVALSEAIRGESRTSRTLRGLLRRRTSGDQVDLDRKAVGAPVLSDNGVTDVVVLASGNLGIISFPQWKERMTFEQLEAAFPHLLPGLVEHPGIALALVTSEQYGPMVIGKDGVSFLKTGAVQGENPLTPFGPHAARHLLREAGFANVPDILVISTEDSASGEVPAFEELVGNHGGLGGWQRHPFVLYPARFDPGAEEIVGAGHLHQVFKGWLKASREVEGWEKPAG
jgi:hypothetical protein